MASAILQLLSGSLIFLAAPTAILILAIGGLRYVTSHGNPAQMEGAKKTVMYAIIGLIVIVLSLAIVANVIKMIGELPTSATSSKSDTPDNLGKGPDGGAPVIGGAAPQSQVK
jgi:amino acid transporter